MIDRPYKPDDEAEEMHFVDPSTERVKRLRERIVLTIGAMLSGAFLTFITGIANGDSASEAAAKARKEAIKVLVEDLADAQRTISAYEAGPPADGPDATAALEDARGTIARLEVQIADLTDELEKPKPASCPGVSALRAERDTAINSISALSNDLAQCRAEKETANADQVCFTRAAWSDYLARRGQLFGGGEPGGSARDDAAPER